MGTPVSSTVVKTFAILELFRHRTSVTTALVKDELGYPHSTAYRLLLGLVSVGVLEQPERDRYTLSLSLFELGSLAPRRRLLCDRARLPLERLTVETGLPTNLAVLDGEHVVLLETLPGRSFSIPTRVGHRAPVHSTSLGKLLLAYADGSARSNVLDKPLHAFTRHTITSRSALVAELATIREQDHATELEETHVGAGCLAVPVKISGICVAGISLSGPIASFERLRSRHLRLLTMTAKEIERGVAWQATLSWPTKERDVS